MRMYAYFVEKFQLRCALLDQMTNDKNADWLLIEILAWHLAHSCLAPSSIQRKRIHCLRLLCCQWPLKQDQIYGAFSLLCLAPPINGQAETIPWGEGPIVQPSARCGVGKGVGVESGCILSEPALGRVLVTTRRLLDSNFFFPQASVACLVAYSWRQKLILRAISLKFSTLIDRGAAESPRKLWI